MTPGSEKDTASKTGRSRVVVGQKPRGRPSVAEGPPTPRLVADKVRQLILEGELSLGSPVTEKWMIARFQASRAATREAIGLLVSERYLVQEPYKSARVRSYSPAEVAEILEARGLLEGFAADNCPRASEAARSRLRMAFGKYADTSVLDSPSATAMAHVELHVAIVGLTDNRELILAERDLMIGSMLLIDRINWNLQDGDKMHNEHLRLVDALLEPDADRARSLTDGHLSLLGGAADNELPGTADQLAQRAR
ncbi:MAG: GntR family transcriptional regulator [Mycobacteriaceae bacterium]|uniref:GntR family transcriptional regulator n=1 Tax=Corynebacterium sp. TaxID=1720 RepID=UPI003F944183